MIVSCYSKKDAVDLAFTLLPNLGQNAQVVVAGPAYCEGREVLSAMYDIRVDEDPRSAIMTQHSDGTTLVLKEGVVAAIPIGDGSRVRAMEWDLLILLEPNRMPREVVEALVFVDPVFAVAGR